MQGQPLIPYQSSRPLQFPAEFTFTVQPTFPVWRLDRRESLFGSYFLEQHRSGLSTPFFASFPLLHYIIAYPTRAGQRDSWELETDIEPEMKKNSVNNLIWNIDIWTNLKV